MEKEQGGKTMKKHKLSDFCNMGSAIGLCAAVGVVLGALLGDPVLWLCLGAGVGVVLGAVCVSRQKRPS